MSYALIILVVYGFISSLAFDEKGFGGIRFNELIYYILTLLPPFIFCLLEYRKFKKSSNDKEATLYMAGGLIYLIGGTIFLLIWSNFYLLGN